MVSQDHVLSHKGCHINCTETFCSSANYFLIRLTIRGQKQSLRKRMLILYIMKELQLLTLLGLRCHPWLQEISCFKEIHAIIYGKLHVSTELHVETHKQTWTQQKRGNLGSRWSNFLSDKERCDGGSQCLSPSRRVVLATAFCFHVLAGKDRDYECVRGKKAAGDRLEDIDFHDDSFIHDFSQIFGRADLCFPRYSTTAVNSLLVLKKEIALIN